MSIQHIAPPVTALDPLPWRTDTSRRREDCDPQELHVEQILCDRYDEQDHHRAIARLRRVRPDMTVQQIEATVDDLLTLSDEAYGAYVSGPYTVFDEAACRYEVALHEFTHGGVPRVVVGVDHTKASER
jgi:hypothetical protein